METGEADAELVLKDGIRAAINRATHAARFIFGIVERTMARCREAGAKLQVLRKIFKVIEIFGSTTCAFVYLEVIE